MASINDQISLFVKNSKLKKSTKKAKDIKGSTFTSSLQVGDKIEFLVPKKDEEIDIFEESLTIKTRSVKALFVPVIKNGKAAKFYFGCLYRSCVLFEFEKDKNGNSVKPLSRQTDEHGNTIRRESTDDISIEFKENSLDSVIRDYESFEITSMETEESVAHFQEPEDERIYTVVFYGFKATKRKKA